MTGSPLPGPRLRERVLGAFVCCQLIAIPLGSYIKFVPVRIPDHRGELSGDLQSSVRDPNRCREPMQSVSDGLAYAVSRWSEVSGQGQCWALFATFGKQGTFPIVELRWDDGSPPVELTSYFDPADPSRYFYPPEPRCRLYNYENRMVITPFIWDADKESKEPDRCRNENIRQVGDMHHSIGAFLRWKVAQHRRRNPDAKMPDEVILKAHVLPNPPPGTSRLNRPEAVVIPVARWRPSEACEEFLPLEAWDRGEHRFVKLRRSEYPS